MSDTLSTETPPFTVSEILLLLECHYQLSGQLKSLPGYCDLNLLLSCTDGSQYIVKIANSGEPEHELLMQNSAMAHLVRKGLAVPHAIENISTESMTTIESMAGQRFFLRVLTFMPGDFYADVAPEKTCPTLWSDLGKFMAKIDQGLSDFQHAGAYRYLIWDLAQGYGVCQLQKQLFDPEQKELVDYFLTLYQTQTMPLLSELPQGVIHNDANDMNLLIDDKQNPTAITGLIDFGDMVHTQLINELAITAAYVLMNQNDPLKTLGILVAGYHQVRPLADLELEVLFPLIALRLSVSVCNSAAAFKDNPDNDYLLVSAQPAWELLRRLRNLNSYAVLCQLRLACG
ncbi:MAG: phosphotransferase, partial [Deltaproteobacteria bacterium]|nr:phosphotransferase [Deltaproteobacteria bacterium]